MWSNLVQGLGEVIDDIVDVFCTNAQSDSSRRNVLL